MSLGSLIENIIASEELKNAGFIILKLAAIIFIALIILKVILGIVRKTLEKSSFDEVLYNFIIKAVKSVGIIIMIIVCLDSIGVKMSTVIAVVGAAGAAIALALRDSLANIAGGIMIIVTKPFNRDDFIDVGTVSGKVKDIDLFITTLMTYDNKTITVPNGVINTSILVNHSREGKRRVDCKFGIGYGSDITEVKRLMQNVCNDSSMILKDPEPLIGVSEHKDSMIIMDLFAWCHTEDYWDVKYFLEEKVREVFDENDINIPYPHMDVIIRGRDREK